MLTDFTLDKEVKSSEVLSDPQKERPLSEQEDRTWKNNFQRYDHDKQSLQSSFGRLVWPLMAQASEELFSVRAQGATQKNLPSTPSSGHSMHDCCHLLNSDWAVPCRIQHVEAWRSMTTSTWLSVPHGHHATRWCESKPLKRPVQKRQMSELFPHQS